MSLCLHNVNSSLFQPKKPLIENGTIAGVRLTIIKGGYNNVDQGWTDDCATRNDKTGTVYLKLNVTVTSGAYFSRSFITNIGLYSPKSDRYAYVGKQLLRNIFDSAEGLDPTDQSPKTTQQRQDCHLADFDGLEFTACIGINECLAPYAPQNCLVRAIFCPKGDKLGGSTH